MQASPASRARPSSDLLDPQPAWVAPSSGHRPHWAQRQQRQQTQQQQPARQPKRLPSDKELPTMTPWMCWGYLSATLSSLSGASSGSWPVLPTSTGSTEFCGGASCTAA
ncbi:TPA: hypothetical protein ACH3X1_008102 [Trebouxia sp. C0004]